MALVSVIVPCFNNAEFVQQAIQSVLQQGYPHIEVIVIDDGSRDSSLDIIQAFGDAIRWETQPNQGAPAARNRGLALARGTYVKFLDADDILLPGSIGRQVQQSQQIPQDRKAIVYGEALWVDQNRHLLSGYSLRDRQPSEDQVSHILTACPLTSCPLHRRDYLLEVDGFDPTLPRGQEHDLHLRLALADVEFMYFPQAVYEYRNYNNEARISNRALTPQESLVQYDILKRQRALVEAKLGQPLPSGIRKALAQRYWKFGRAVLREDCPDIAEQYFQAAIALDAQHCIIGNFPYRPLVQWVGPYQAEAILTRLKCFRRRLMG